ncbi:MAG TPA: tetratricopeptide repeat protein [Kofleriaceae bacterium]|nr:tetratricopeptide repeat protein [Kofleriaceae bacterium]
MKTLTLAILMGLGAVASAKDKPNDKMPVTTASPDARDMYMKAQDLADKLRGTDAHEMFAKAVAKDKDFALAYLGMANTSGTGKDFFDALGKAVALEGKVSPGEKLLIQAADQGAKNDLAHQKESLDKLAQMFPSDERVANQLGAYYFGRQDYAQSIASYEKAIKINPAFTQPYNQLGYAYRFAGKSADAERTFKKYIELIPSDPNPYDSYGELLMEEGKFDESIASYKKALAIDGNFVASFIGMGNDQMFEGHGEDARKTFAQFSKVARTDGERRQAIFWTAIAYSFDGAWDKALAEGDKMVAIAKERKDNAMLANDYNFIANTLLEAGRPDEAAAKYKLQQELNDKADLPAEVKETTRRGGLYDEARVALAKHDLKTAKAKAAAYAKQVSVKQNPFEVRQQHELLGMIAIDESQWKTAVDELSHANQRDPRVLYLAAVAIKGAGDAKGAKAMAAKAANFNGLAPDYAYVRAKAQALAK